MHFIPESVTIYRWLNTYHTLHEETLMLHEQFCCRRVRESVESWKSQHMSKVQGSEFHHCVHALTGKRNISVSVLGQVVPPRDVKHNLQILYTYCQSPDYACCFDVRQISTS